VLKTTLKNNSVIS